MKEHTGARFPCAVIRQDQSLILKRGPDRSEVVRGAIVYELVQPPIPFFDLVNRWVLRIGKCLYADNQFVRTGW